MNISKYERARDRLYELSLRIVTKDGFSDSDMKTLLEDVAGRFEGKAFRGHVKKSPEKKSKKKPRT